jgi:hypothetical protein
VVMVIRNSSRACLVAAALGCVMPAGIGAQPSPSDRVLAAVDVEITQRVVNADGSSPWPLQAPTAFTLQKLRTAGGQTKIVLAYHATTAAARTPASSHPLDGARAEYDPSTGALSVFDRGGTRQNPRLSLDPPAAASIGSPADWLDTLVLTAAAIPARRRELERRYGPAAASAGRLTRYVHNGDGVSEEVLVDPGWAVPVEITVMRHDLLEGHVTFEYRPTPSGNLFRHTVRTERVIDAAAGRRSVLALQFSNVRAEGW